MDNFSEYLVKRRRRPVEWALLVVIAALAVVMAFLTLSYFIGSALLFTGFLVLGYLYIRYSSVEYEYTQTNVYLDIDRINGQRRRKRLLSTKVTDMTAFAPYTSIPQSVVDNKKKVDYSSGDRDDSVKYYFILDSDHTKYYIFEPNEKMLNNLKLYKPSAFLKES